MTRCMESRKGRGARWAAVLVGALAVACGAPTEERKDPTPTDETEDETRASVAKVVVTPATQTLAEFDSVQLSAVAFDAADEPLEGVSFAWASDDESVATVSASGLVTALGVGTTKVTATAGEHSASAQLVVEAGVVDSVRIGDGQLVEIDVGQSVVLKAFAFDENERELPGRGVKWTVTGGELAVDQTGKLQSALPGVWAKGEVHAEIDGVKATASVVVRLRFKTLATEGIGTCGLDETDRMWCWGMKSAVAEDADGGSIGAASTVPVRVMPDKAFAELSVGGRFRCGIDFEGQAWCLGEEKRKSVVYAVPWAVEGDHRFHSLSAGGAGACALDDDNALWCWGKAFGNVKTPVAQEPTRRFLSVQLGPNSTGTGMASPLVAVDEEGAFFAWGRNNKGLLFPGGDPSITAPKALFEGETVGSIAIGDSHLCALMDDGVAYCQGDGEKGQTGNAELPTLDEGNEVDGLSFAAVHAGGQYSCGLTEEGAAYCWGWNSVKQLGGATGEHSATPQPVAGNHRFIELALGHATVCGLTTERETVCWGERGTGFLGDGKETGVNEATPVAVVGTTR